MEIKKERLHYIDQLKGIAIFLVVIGHIIQMNSKDFENNVLFSIIYSFHMPLFMFISGYVAFKSTKANIFQSYFKFLVKRVRTLLIPFLSWQLLVNPFFFRDNTISNPIFKFLNLVTHLSAGLWFLWFLFLLTLLYSLFLFISNKLNRKNTVLIDVIVLAVTLIPLLLIKHLQFVSYINSLILYFLFYFLGIFISKFELIKSLISNSIVFSISILIFILLCRTYHFGDESGKNLLIKIILSCSSIISLYNIVKRFKWNPFIDASIRAWGKNSLIIYVTHFSIVSFLSYGYTIPQLEIFPLLLGTTITAIIIILFCLGIARLVETIPLLDLLLYGRKAETSTEQTRAAS